MEDLLEKYGYCEIPKGTILFRGHRGDKINNEMFFGTKYYAVMSWAVNGVQIWRVKKKIRVLFLLKHLNHDAKGISSLPDIYYYINPDEPKKDLVDLDIKQDVTRRSVFAKQLHSQYQVNGWLSSIENGIEMELCLFDRDYIIDCVERVEVINSKKNYEFDSLRKIRVFPLDSFIQSSRKEVRKFKSEFDKSDAYKLHRSNVRAWVKEYVEKGEPESHAKDYYYDLRIKLKI